MLRRLHVAGGRQRRLDVADKHLRRRMQLLATWLPVFILQPDSQDFVQPADHYHHQHDHHDYHAGAMLGFLHLGILRWRLLDAACQWMLRDVRLCPTIVLSALHRGPNADPVRQRGGSWPMLRHDHHNHDDHHADSDDNNVQPSWLYL